MSAAQNNWEFLWLYVKSVQTDVNSFETFFLFQNSLDLELKRIILHVSNGQMQCKDQNQSHICIS